VGAASRCDQIVVLDKGQVLEHGTHDELIAKDGLYARFAEEQRLEGDIEQAESEPSAAGAA
jgi:ABC-type multidrug transport system fused ATPase/permease subunit